MNNWRSTSQKSISKWSINIWSVTQPLRSQGRCFTKITVRFQYTPTWMGKTKNEKYWQSWALVKNSQPMYIPILLIQVKIGIMTLKISLAVSSKDTYTNMIWHFFAWYTPRKKHLCDLEDMNMGACSKKQKENSH